MLTSAWPTGLEGIWVASTVYLVLWNGSQILLGLVAGLSIRKYIRTRTRRDVALTARVASAPMVSIVVPAHNEALIIVESVRSLLALDYEPREIVVVNDGSSDDTLAVLQRTFRLLEAPLAFPEQLATARVRGTYRSISEPALVVIDKENGSKPDALNAGINAAAGVLVLMLDADTVIDAAALRRAVLPFLEDPTTVAVGGNIAVANGCLVRDGRITDIRLPRNWLARFQVVEYMRSFLLFRIACASLNALTIVSGAFGVFRRDALIAIGGYDRTAIGEDLDLTVRLHQYYRARRQPYRIAFDPSPLCSTQAPEDWASLRAQRLRWRRGLLQTLWRHRRMVGNSRLGVLGVGVLPYVILFDVLGPAIEILGYITMTAAAIAGLLDWVHFGTLIVASLAFGIAATLVGVFLSDISTARYMRHGDLLRLIGVAVLENCGYRQLNSWWSCVGTVRALTGPGDWGHMKRTVFEGHKALLLAVLIVAPPVPASAAQDDILAKARAAATSGRRADALSMLEAHLARTPRDVDAKLLLSRSSSIRASGRARTRTRSRIREPGDAVPQPPVRVRSLSLTRRRSRSGRRRPAAGIRYGHADLRRGPDEIPGQLDVHGKDVSRARRRTAGLDFLPRRGPPLLRQRRHQLRGLHVRPWLQPGSAERHGSGDGELRYGGRRVRRRDRPAWPAPRSGRPRSPAG